MSHYSPSSGIAFDIRSALETESSFASYFSQVDEDLFEDCLDIMSNSHLNTNFLNLARELDIMEPKTPEDVYKTHLDSVRPFGGGSSVDSARQNLVSKCSLPGVGREVVVIDS